MTALRTVIVDDEELARERLRSMLAHHPNIEIVGEAEDGDSAIRVIREYSPDLVFLDVQIPQANGFDVIRGLPPGSIPLIVFVTAYDQYALRAFDVNACDYLLKPFDEARLAETVDRVSSRYDGYEPPAGTALQAVLAHMHAAPCDQVVVKADGRYIFFDADEIDWIEVVGKELRIHSGTSVLRVRESMNSFERRLPPHRFIRVHRSAIINRSRLREMQPWFQGEYLLILRDGTRVVTGRRYRDDVQTLMRHRAVR
jgi:two-component system LytT family response regulator